MILCADIPSFVWQLYDFNEMSVGIFAHTLHACGLKFVSIAVIKFKAVAMALADFGFAVSLSGVTAFAKTAIECAETHSATHIRYRLLLLHKVDDLVGCAAVHFGRICICHAEHVTCKLNDHALHAETDAESRNIMLATPF